jgi:pyruvate carboxylase
VADAAVASMSGQTSQPNLNSIVAALAHRRASGLSLDALNQYSDYWEVVREFYAPFDTGPKSGTAEVYLHEMPGGQYTNLKEQAESMGLGLRWHELARTYADVNMAFGDIVKVTPSSKVVGDMAIFLVNHNMTMEQFARLTPDHNAHAAQFGDRDVHGLAGRARRRLAEEAAGDHPARRQAAIAAAPARICPR